MASPPVISADDPIEGSWNGFRLKIAQEEDFPAMVENIRLHFCKDEPMSACLKSSPSLVTGVEEYAKIGLSESGGQSLVAYDESTGEVAGVRISHLWQKGKPSALYDPNPKMAGDFCPFYEIMAELGDTIKPDMFSKFGVDKVVEFHLLSVADKYRQKDLAYEMSLRSLRLAKNSGLHVVKVCYTSAYSRRIGERLGFDVYGETKYSDYKKDGKFVFKDVKPPHTSVILMFKQV